ncbi:Retrovirus-related Pol polyprotein from transposon TNT 1-94 [Dendrobium catenatum]|uniref:Retrovirus-related Pol polyprotein from transposon TNT 1-94 n=1 Tax=Dendrobium catenatum TaxID=906689 RepID=A0A2I0W6S9_9ASPA|nr:Retrovirus-related Pol polyprotein from transposon TNT 1-94 [Dendrobium catenatum]
MTTPNSASASSSGATIAVANQSPTISPSLKFVISNLKLLVPHALTADNFPIWSTQIAKLFKANGFAPFLDPRSATENVDPNQDPNSWSVTDQNLATAMCSTISPAILPYVINLESTSDIWTTLHTRFQSSNRSKVIQLKNELHNVAMQTMSMTQYLTEIKKIVDQISSAGSSVDSEDVMIYILNGLPPEYHSFTTTIRTMQTTLSLDQLYALLMSEEIHLKSAALKLTKIPDTQTALYTYRGRGRRGRGRLTNDTASANKSSQTSNITCQICKKRGHQADACWHRLNPNYVPTQTSSKNQSALLANSDNNNVSDWYIDSGASSHMTNKFDNLANAHEYLGQDSVTIGDGRSIQIAHSGTGILPTPTSTLLLSRLLHVPSLSYNLLSISKLVQDNPISITFDANGFVFKDRMTGLPILKGPCKEGLYTVTDQLKPHPKALSADATTQPDWHLRLGHPHQQILRLISHSNPTLNISFSKSFCNLCASCKGHKLTFDNSLSKTTAPLDLIHSDVWGPSPVSSIQGFKYYVIFVDDYSRFIWFFPLMFKSDVTRIFIQFVSLIERQTNRKLKVIRTDCGGEFLNHQFKNFTRKAGIIHQTSCPYTPEQNGIAERKHRHIITTARTLLHTAGLPLSYWLDAATTATYLINRLPSGTTENTSPLQRMFNITPSYNHMRTFGCECYPLLPPTQRTKLTTTSSQCVFLGYAETMKGYRCLNTHNHQIIVSRHVKFNESCFPFKHRSTQASTPPDLTQPSLLIPTSISNPTNPGRQSAQLPVPQPSSSQTQPIHISSAESSESGHNETSVPPPAPTHTHHMITRNRTGNLKPVTKLNLLHAELSQTDPTTFTEANKHFKWRRAMSDEFFALQKQGTWDLVEPPPNSSILGSKWTYRTKRNADGSVARHKARLVAQGNQQEFGLDYQETFSPVAKLPTIRILFTIALFHKWPIQQLDVANAFLHGDINEITYMTQPRGFEDSSNPDHVCRLRKAIYGLRQAPRQWYTTFTSYLLLLGFKHSQADPSLLSLHNNHIHIYLLVYVDDILITGNDPDAIKTLVTQLQSKFTMKNLGNAHHFLGIAIESSPDKYFLSQTTYAQSILRIAELQKCNSVSNPLATKTPDVSPTDPPCFSTTAYRRIIGSLQYLTLTRPDIAYAVNMLSQHMHCPEVHHTALLKKLLRYIQGTLAYGLPITRSNLTLRTYSDADWASDPITRKSTTGFCTFLGDTLISWTVKKQATVSRSSTESEYRALASATADTIWIKKLLTDFLINHSQPVDLFCDNTSTIALANNPVFHARTKHIEIDQRFVRDHIQNKVIRLLPISSEDQLADILTKPLSTHRFKLLRSKLTIGPNCQFAGEC